MESRSEYVGIPFGCCVLVCEIAWRVSPTGPGVPLITTVLPMMMESSRGSGGGKAFQNIMKHISPWNMKLLFWFRSSWCSMDIVGYISKGSFPPALPYHSLRYRSNLAMLLSPNHVLIYLCHPFYATFHNLSLKISSMIQSWLTVACFSIAQAPLCIITTIDCTVDVYIFIYQWSRVEHRIG